MLGLPWYYQKFIPAYAKLVWPLMQLTHKTVPFIWMDHCQKAFETLKDALMKGPILVYLGSNKTYTLIRDVLKYALSAVSTQEDELLMMIK